MEGAKAAKKKPIKKLPAIPDRRELLLTNEFLILVALKDAKEQSSPEMTAWEIGQAVSRLKHEGKRETQTQKPIAVLKSRGAIESRLVKDKATGRKATRHKITPRGIQTVEAAVRLLELLTPDEE